MGLPPLLTLEIVVFFVIAFLVIIPLPIVPLTGPFMGNLWTALDRSVTNSLADNKIYCPVNDLGLEYCKEVVGWNLLFPIILLSLLCISAVLVSFFVDISARKNFINKQIVTALTEQKEVALMKQKMEHENLIHSCFPPPIAEDLIERQSQRDHGSVDARVTLRSINGLGRLVARMHQQVTIFFSDIVGFTSMSQTCKPYQVMHFLHILFTVSSSPSLYPCLFHSLTSSHFLANLFSHSLAGV